MASSAVYELTDRLGPLNELFDGFTHLYSHHRPHGGSAFTTYARSDTLIFGNAKRECRRCAVGLVFSGH